MKKKYYLLILFFVMFMGYLYLRPSSNNSIESINVANIAKVRIGDSESRVIEIMGIPIEKELYYLDSSLVVFVYDAPDISAGDINIFLDTLEMKVNRIMDHDDF